MIAYVGDIGTIINLDTQSDLTGATTLEMEIKKPSGATVTKTAAIPVGLDATDGIITYATIAGDFDEAGKYYIQAHIASASTDHLGATASFEVKAAFDGN